LEGVVPEDDRTFLGVTPGRMNNIASVLASVLIQDLQIGNNIIDKSFISLNAATLSNIIKGGKLQYDPDHIVNFWVRAFQNGAINFEGSNDCYEKNPHALCLRAKAKIGITNGGVEGFLGDHCDTEVYIALNHIDNEKRTFIECTNNDVTKPNKDSGSTCSNDINI